MEYEQAFKRLEKEMPGYYLQLIPAMLCAGSICLAAEILRYETDSVYQVPLYILLFGVVNYMFYKSLLRIVDQVYMKQAISERDIAVFMKEERIRTWLVQFIFLITMTFLNGVLVYVWFVLENSRASIFLFLLLGIQIFKGIQAKIQFRVFLRAISTLK